MLYCRLACFALTEDAPVVTVQSRKDSILGNELFVTFMEYFKLANMFQ